MNRLILKSKNLIRKEKQYKMLQFSVTFSDDGYLRPVIVATTYSEQVPMRNLPPQMPRPELT